MSSFTVITPPVLVDTDTVCTYSCYVVCRGDSWKYERAEVKRADDLRLTFLDLRDDTRTFPLHLGAYVVSQSHVIKSDQFLVPVTVGNQPLCVAYINTYEGVSTGPNEAQKRLLVKARKRAEEVGVDVTVAKIKEALGASNCVPVKTDVGGTMDMACFLYVVELGGDPLV